MKSSFSFGRLARAGGPGATRRSGFRRVAATRFWPYLSLLILTGVLSVQAFPPAPHHLIYGMVRDENGNPVSASNAEVFLQGPTGPEVKATILTGLGAGRNYQLAVPMDAGLTQDLYKPTALRPTLPFKLRVRIGQTVYLPIEMKGDYAQMGKPAQSTHLDLTLGEDSDGDGIPDAWEKALIAQSGGTKTLKDIKPGDDFDGDGLSNLKEYLAGTYAFDPMDGFSLKSIQKDEKATVLEFLTIRGRTYSVHGSEDFQDWTTAGFRLSSQPAGSRQTELQATDTKVVRIELDSPEGAPARRFYKLLVQ